MVRLLDGTSIHEQQKHSVDPSRSPFGDTSKDLWNTLGIWLDAVRAGEIQLATTEFYLTTNRKLSNCIARRISQDPKALMKCVQELRTAGATAPEGIGKLVIRVTAHSDTAICDLLKRIRVCDADGCSSGLALRSEVASLLHLPESVSWDLMLDALSGWVHEQIKARWRAGLPALIAREAFDTQYQALLARFRQRAVRADPPHLVPVPQSEVNKLLNAEFVEQLRSVALVDENEEVIEAINDFVRCGRERLRLSNSGDLTRDEVVAFDDSLERRWRQSCRVRVGRPRVVNQQGPHDPAEVGYQILMDALTHREPLGGVDQEQYMTSGAFHWMADAGRVWWHPDYPNRKKSK